MSKEAGDDRRASTGASLSASELDARRAAWRRQRARRRRAVLLASIAVVAVAVAVAAIALTSGSGSPDPAAPSSTAAAGGHSLAGKTRSAGAGRRSKGDRSVRPQVDQQALGVDRVLAYTSYVQYATQHRRDVALTFDDGPGLYTGAILHILRVTHTPATFFVIGRWALDYPRLVAAEVRAGCEVGDHTQTHYPLALLSASAQTAELTQAAQAIHRARAPWPVLMRPPYGSFDPITLQVLRAQRMLMVLWSADTSDYERPGVSKIIYVALSSARPGAIILMHDGGGDRSETVAALPRIIERLHQRGYRLVTVSQLIADDPPPVDQPPPTPLSGGAF
jgi:peptidoglycan/xylan/chitin deacetylase (PgdA/CDA1 family)